MSVYWLKLHDMRFPLRLGETLLGRSPYCSIVLNDGLVSRQHAAIRVTRDGVHVEDLGSRNGTSVNQRKIVGSHPLSPGDRITIGAHTIEVELDSREERPHHETLAATGEHKIPLDEDTIDVATEPGRLPGYHDTLRR